MALMATIKDVAKHANVSTATVSHVINNTRFVSEETKSKVLNSMEALNYKPNAIARSLRRKETKIIGLVIPDNTNPYFAEIAWSIEMASSKLGYSIILCNSDGDIKKESFYINLLIEKQVDGVVLVSAGESTENFRFLQENEIPTVMVDRESPNVNTDSVQIDNAGCGEMATKHLISLGHKKIACITGPSQVTPSYDRLIGYKKALTKAGLPIFDDYIIKGDFRPQGGYFAAKKLINLKDPPTAIFACNDLMAFGVNHAITEAGYSIPQDFSLVGFDDIYLSTYVNPPLTTIRQPRIEMGREAIDCLLMRIKDNVHYSRSVSLSAELIVRSSTMRI
jgi:LacI family transcriptional regulator